MGNFRLHGGVPRAVTHRFRKGKRSRILHSEAYEFSCLFERVRRAGMFFGGDVTNATCIHGNDDKRKKAHDGTRNGEISWPRFFGRAIMPMSAAVAIVFMAPSTADLSLPQASS